MKWLADSEPQPTMEPEVSTEVNRIINRVLAIRCMRHKAVRPLNDNAQPGECAVCASNDHAAVEWLKTIESEEFQQWMRQLIDGLYILADKKPFDPATMCLIEHQTAESIAWMLERLAFVAGNHLSLIEERDQAIKNQAAVITRLEASRLSLRTRLKRSLDGSLTAAIVDKQVTELRRYYPTELPAHCCADCHLMYGAPGFVDVYVQDDVWERIKPAHDPQGGILCLSCIVRRCALLGLERVPVQVHTTVLAITVE
jgi:hypothetical protein